MTLKIKCVYYIEVVHFQLIALYTLQKESTHRQQYMFLCPQNALALLIEQIPLEPTTSRLATKEIESQL